MKWLKAGVRWSWWRASVSRRIALIMLTTTVLTGAIAAISLRGLSVLNGQLDSTVMRQAEAVELVERVLEGSQRLSDSARRAAAAATPEERDRILAELDAVKKDLGEQIDAMSIRLNDAPELKKALEEGYSSFVISAVKTSRMLKAGKTDMANQELLTSFDPRLLSYVLTTISGVSKHTDQSMRAVAQKGHATYRLTMICLAAIAAAVAIVVVAGHFMIRRTIILPVRRVARAAEQLARGQFDLDLTSSSRDECGEMLQAMSELRAQLSTMIRAIEKASTAVVTTADSLAGSNQELSARAQDHARAIGDASNVLGALSTMAQESATKAERVTRDMREAHKIAAEGNDIISQVMSTMAATVEASRRIAATVGTINEIAFTTNILSLNAAVEAARAGEQGRSFAVVAAEVRTLATKSAAAAREIESLIANSTESVNRSSTLVTRAGGAMQVIVKQVEAAAAGMRQISDASREQSERAVDVSRAISEIDAGTQRNADMALRATASTETLRGEAHTLAESLEGLGGGHEASPRAGETSRNLPDYETADAAA